MDDKRQSFVSSSTDFFYNLFGADLNTPPSANDHMQYMHPTHFDNEAGSSSAIMQMNTTPLQFQSNDEPQQPQSPRHNPPRNKRVATAQPVTIIVKTLFGKCTESQVI